MSDKRLFDPNNPEDVKVLNDIWQAAFEAGVAYTFGHLSQDKLNPVELSRFADWIELKCPWKTYEEWYSMIVRNYVHLTPERYEECKRRYIDNKEKNKDVPFWFKHYLEAEEKLDREWEQILKTGTYKLEIPVVLHNIIIKEFREEE